MPTSQVCGFLLYFGILHSTGRPAVLLLIPPLPVCQWHLFGGHMLWADGMWSTRRVPIPPTLHLQCNKEILQRKGHSQAMRKMCLCKCRSFTFLLYLTDGLNKDRNNCYGNLPPLMATSPKQLFGTLGAQRLWQLNLQSDKEEKDTVKLLFSFSMIQLYFFPDIQPINVKPYCFTNTILMSPESTP